MRYKPLPPAPDSVDAIRDAHQALPLVPAGEDDCCARLMDRTGTPSRDEARTWITFLTALGLAAEREHGYVRLPDDPTTEDLAKRFVDGVYGAREVIEFLADADGPVSAATIDDEMNRHVPAWERQRQHGSAGSWRSRTRRLLDWLVLLGLVEAATTGYTRAT